jgi:hypothetical protein
MNPGLSGYVAASVARMSVSDMRDLFTSINPDYASLHPGYACFARSRPTVVTDGKLLIDFSMDGVPSDDCINDNHLGTPLMRLMPVRVPSTPSP